MSIEKDITTIQISTDIRTALNIVKAAKNLKNYSEAIDYLFKRANIDVTKIQEIFEMLND